MKYLDLFSGVGGFTRGLLDAGFTFSWHGFSEIDKHANGNAVSSPVVQEIAERLICKVESTI